MKKQILALSLILISFYACSSDNSEAAPEKIKGEIKVDYKVITESVEDFVVNTDNVVYYTGQVNTANTGLMVFNKIDLDGKKTAILNLDKSIFFNNRLTYNNAGEILMFTFDSKYSNELFRFGNNFSEVKAFYAIKAGVNSTSISAISKNEDDSYFFFDYGNLAIRKVNPALNTDVQIAGSGKKEVKDGNGSEASFGDVYVMVSKNNIIYVMDGIAFPGSQNNIRKVELLATGWKVSTLISTTTDIFSSIAIGPDGDLFVLVKDKGIFKLNQQNNTLALFKDGELKIEVGKEHSAVNLNYATTMKIKNNDLYLSGSAFPFIKISDFQSKFLQADK